MAVTATQLDEQYVGQGRYSEYEVNRPNADVTDLDLVETNDGTFSHIEVITAAGAFFDSRNVLPTGCTVTLSGVKVTVHFEGDTPFPANNTSVRVRFIYGAGAWL